VTQRRVRGFSEELQGALTDAQAQARRQPGPEKKAYRVSFFDFEVRDSVTIAK
jgi:hypothetical protein